MEYGLQLTLAVLGVSASYFIDISNSITLLNLIFVPLLFGYTASISNEGFNTASLLTLTTIVFTFVGGITSILALLYSLGNVLVSVFAGGIRFKEFYSSTSIPLLLTGLILGASIFGYGTINPEFKQEKIGQTAQKIGDVSQSTFSNSKILENQKNRQLRAVNQTARTAVILTTQKVINESTPSREVLRVLQDAQTDVPNEVYTRTKENAEKQGSPISGRVSGMFTETFTGSKFILVIPAMAAFFFSLQPLIGLLTAIFATIFFRIEGDSTET